MTSMRANVSISEIRSALAERDLEDISSLDDNDVLDIFEVEIEQSEIDECCEQCGGHGTPDPEPVVNINLIADFLIAVRSGDIATAKAMVGRVFDEMGDVSVVENALCRCAA